MATLRYDALNDRMIADIGHDEKRKFMERMLCEQKRQASAAYGGLGGALMDWDKPLFRANSNSRRSTSDCCSCRTDLCLVESQMNEQDWQARALEMASTVYVSDVETRGDSGALVLTFAKEYAAEALAEVERLNQLIKERESDIANCNRTIADLRAQRADQIALKESALSLVERAHERAQLAAAGPVKVPDARNARRI